MKGAAATWSRAVPVLLALVVNLGALTPGFIHDDHRIIEQNVLVRDPSRMPEIFTRGYWSVEGTDVPNLYRPLTTLSFAFNHAVGGLSPFGYRAVNLMLHLLVTGLVVGLARRALAPRGGPAGAGPLVAGLLFAVHPVHTEVLGEVVGRSELLAAAGVVGGVLAFLRARDRDDGGRGFHAGWAALSLACFALGFLSKENAVVGPVLAILADRLLGRRRIALGFHLASGAVIAVLLGLRIAVLGGLNPAGPIHFVDNPIAHAPFWQGRLTALAVLGRYAWLLIAPVRLSIDHSYDAVPLVSGPLDPWLIFGALVMAGWTVGVILAVRRSGATALALLWIGVALAPVANVLMPIGTIMAERLLYLPSVGVCLLAAAGVRAAAIRAAGPDPGRAPAGGLRVFGAVLLVLFAARSAARLRDWRDDHSIFRAAVAVHPRSVRALFNYGSACERRGEDAEARRVYESAIGIYDRFDEAHYNLAGLHARHGEWVDAVEHYRRALALRPDEPRYLVNLGHSLNGRGSHDEARAVLERAIRIDPTSGEAWTNLGAALLGGGDAPGAVTAYAEAARIDPQSAGYQRNLGLALQRAGRHAEAAEALRRALELAPANVDLFAAIGLARLDAGDVTGGLEALREAVRLRPEQAVYRYQLGRALEAADRGEEAEQSYREAIRLAPSSPVPLAGLGLLLYRRGESGEARTLLERASALDPTGGSIGAEARRVLEELRGGPPR